MKSKKDNSEWRYDITEIIGKSSPEANLYSDWFKRILNRLHEHESCADDNGCNEYSKRIQLFDVDATLLADTLIKNGYGSTDIIESEYKKRLGDRTDDI